MAHLVFEDGHEIEIAASFDQALEAIGDGEGIITFATDWAEPPYVAVNVAHVRYVYEGKRAPDPASFRMEIL
jgi:hypothetical protein